MCLQGKWPNVDIGTGVTRLAGDLFSPDLSRGTVRATMRAIVAQPSVKDFYFTPHRAAALGAHRVAELLGEGGDVVVMNLPLLTRRARSMPLPAEFSHLQPFVTPDEFGPTSFFPQFHRYGPRADEAAHLILAQEPDRVFISCFAFCYAAEAIDLAAALRRLRPELWVGIGGAGPSVWPEYFAAAGSSHGEMGTTGVEIAPTRGGALPTGALDRHGPLFDSVYVGEAEGLHVGLSAFRKRTAAGSTIHGAGHRTPIIRPVWAVVGENRQHVSVSMSVTRGCPERCGFCSNRLTHGPAFRVPDWGQIEAALCEIARVAEGRTLRLNIEDDNILCAEGLLERIAEHLIASGVALSLTAENGLDYRLLDEAMVARLSKLGLRQLNLSLAIEEGPLERSQSRGTRLDHLAKVLDAAAIKGVDAVTYFICGLPGQSAGEVASILRLLRELPTRLGISLYYPVRGLPGSPGDGVLWKVHPRLTAGSSAYPWAGLSTSQLVTAFRLARYINLEREADSRDTRFDTLKERIRRGGRLLTLIRRTPDPVRPPGICEDLEDMVIRQR